MRKIRRAVGIAAGGLALLAGAAAPVTAAPAPGNDRAQIAELEQRQLAAWAACDAAGFASIFSHDADLVAFNGDYFTTRAGIEAGMTRVWERYCQHTRIRQHDRRVDFPTRDTAVIVRESCLINPGETECRAGSHSVNTNMFVKRHGTWLQRSFQNTRVEPLP